MSIEHSDMAPPEAGAARRRLARLLWAAVACCLPLALLGLAGRPAAARPSVLYDAALGGTPDAPGQGMVYRATDSGFRGPPAAAAQSYLDGLTELQTSAELGDHAGYTAEAALVPDLDQAAGYTLTLRVQIVAEQHSYRHRAGFSLTVLGADRRGVELGFWEDRVWAQSASPPFTHAEEALVDTTAMTTYELAVRGDSYTLRGGGATLTGPLRSYQAPGLPVYSTPNFIFLGDNTTGGGALARIAYVAVAAAAPPEPAAATPTSTPAPSAAPAATASPAPTRTAAPGPGRAHVVLLPLAARP